ncbi:MAG: BMP family ABC transporter substrate-binding protein, partial [Clostridia bacterium]|nr:BMP family ABC transporter substrate-binding protein [Clostridia bacterium]
LKEGKIALVTDVGTIDDESFNQGTWEGALAYADANGIEINYYQPTADSTDARMQSIDQAIKEGATVIVVPGYLFGEAMLQAPAKYPEVNFIAIDVNPATDMGGATPASNLYCIYFAEEQCGFLAGYGAVMDGYTDLGFLGGIAVPAVVRYGQGYLQGIDAAAQEKGVDVKVKYTYGGQFYGDEKITAKMEGWYSAGTQVVFACGGGIWSSPAEAAMNHNGYLIGVDVNQHPLGEDTATYAYNPFITSAVKALGNATQDALALSFTDKFDTVGGTAANLGLQQGDYVGLPTDTASWGFKTFTVEQYEAEKAKIMDGSVTIDNNQDAAIHAELSDKTTVEYID